MNAFDDSCETGQREPEAVVLLGVLFHNVTFDDALRWALRRMREGRPSVIATVNVDFVMQAWKDAELHETLMEADLVVADGAPIVALSSKFGPRLRQRVTGSDLTPMLARACAQENLGVFLLGARPGVAQKAARVLREQNPGLRVVGCHSPPMAPLSGLGHEEIFRQLETAQPHLLLVAFGAPKQEKFIRQNLPRWNIPLAIGVGGTLDFLAGVQWRAPQLIQKLGVEWLWRLATDPARLLRRYYQNLFFLVQTLVQLLCLRARGMLSPELCSGSAESLQGEFKRLDTRLIDMEDFSEAEVGAMTERFVLVDLGSRHWLKSRELALLVTSARNLKRKGGRLSVICPSKTLRDFFCLCHLDRFIRLFSDSAEALREIEQASSEGGPG